MAPPAAAATPRAVAYLRMSTDEQVHSLANQIAAVAAFAETHGYDLVRTYEDAGVSGRRTNGRAAFKALLATVLGGEADFEVILVYDVSRWGRFEDPDEAGHYEYLCAREGVRIAFCAEPFTGQAGAGAALMKGLKRAMAAEFSRELGAKVGQAQARRAALGHWMHGRPGYGLRRQLTDAEGRPVRLLKDGERKADPGHHTVLVAGPRREREVVRRIHRRFTQDGATLSAIAQELNAELIAAEAGGRWTTARVRQILANPKYAGDLVARRRLAQADGLRAPDGRTIVADAVPPIISRKAFAATQTALAASRALRDADLLEALREIAAVHGVVGERRLKALGVAHVSTYACRFGSLRAAFARVGHHPPRNVPKRLSDKALLDGLVRLFQVKGDISRALIDAEAQLPHAETYRRRFGSLADAYGRIGFVPLGPGDLASPVGRARAAARQARLQAWRFGEPQAPDEAPADRPGPTSTTAG